MTTLFQVPYSAFMAGAAVIATCLVYVLLRTVRAPSILLFGTALLVGIALDAFLLKGTAIEGWLRETREQLGGMLINSGAPEGPGVAETANSDSDRPVAIPEPVESSKAAKPTSAPEIPLSPAQLQLCYVINDPRPRYNALESAYSKETNGLRKAELNRQATAIATQALERLNSFIVNNSIVGYVGTVIKISADSRGRQARLTMSLGCEPSNASLIISFSKNPLWYETRLDPFEAVLKQLSSGDTISVSGSFVDGHTRWWLGRQVVTEEVSLGVLPTKIEKQ